VRRFAVLAILLLPSPAAAHDAFGDLGPFYANLLHPLADPRQGLLIAAVAVLLSRHPLSTVRPAYAALALAGTGAALLGAFVSLDPPGLRMTGLIAAALGLLALFGMSLRPMLAILVAAAIAAVAGAAIDLPAELRTAGLAALGASLGIALAALLVWGLVDEAIRRFGPVAGAVAGSWIAAVGVMAAALPTS
jgi:hypothetical protein